jgi:asparagine synthase (glutamine-hydrolysing)
MATPTTVLDSSFAWLKPLLSRYGRVVSVGERLYKGAEILALASPEALYYQLTSHWKEPTALVHDSYEPPTLLTNRQEWAHIPELVQRMMYLDMCTYLPDDILVKVDRASMGVSLEARVPFLDHRLVEFVWSLPLAMKIHRGQSKWILRQVLYQYVPPALIKRPKTGFGIPIDSWLRGPLREWAEALLDEKRLREEGFFNPQPIRKKWDEHLTGTYNWHYYLWDVLMFQAWLENQNG